MPGLTHFGNITLLITHYNRSKSLERLLEAFQRLGCSFGDIVVSDDASQSGHLDYMQKLQLRYPFRLITTPENGGLGNNMNKGQEAVTTPYTLYVQEDFLPTDLFPASLADALSFMEKDNGLDKVRFSANVRYPYLKPYGKGFSEMVYTLWQPDYMKVYAYSDHPHLRRSDFLVKFGRYREGIKGDRTEYFMCVSFIQKKGRGLFFDEYKRLFTHENSSDEPSTMVRTAKWKDRNNLFVNAARTMYRIVRYNYDMFLKR